MTKCRHGGTPCASAFGRPRRISQRTTSAGSIDDDNGRYSGNVVSELFTELTQRFVAAAPRLTLLLVRRYGVSYDFARDTLQQTLLRLMQGAEPQFESDRHFENFMLR